MLVLCKLVKVSKVLWSDYGQSKFTVIVRVRVG